MRVLVAGHTYLRRFNQRKWEAFADLSPRHGVLLVVPNGWRDPHFGPVKPQPSRHPRVHVRITRALFRGHGTLTFHVDPRLAWVARRFRPDIVLVEQEPHSLLALQGRSLAQVLPGRPPFTFFTWGGGPNRRRPLPLRILERGTLRAARVALAGNQAARDQLRVSGFVHPIHRIPQVGVDLPDRPEPTRRQVRRELGISGVVVGFAGRLIAEKGVLDLAEALSGLGCLDWTFLTIGRGPLRDALKLRFGADGLAGRLRVVEDADHYRVGALLTALDVLVLPSHTTADWAEQFGHVLIEAMAAGCPVVGTDSGEIPHVIGNAGIVVPERDVGQLRATLRSLIEDPGLRARLVACGRARVQHHFTHAKVARRLAGCLEQVPARPATGRAA
ncbi:MAG: glycosyltransferase family 4 protein [Chloroflexi bacterium]|nr:glycosyltransferase family 4 protein [Chloroflexota bacterium]